MRLLDIAAPAHPGGNRIDLSWTNPAPVAFPACAWYAARARIRSTPDDGVVVADGTGLAAATDLGLQGETSTTTACFLSTTTRPVFDVDPHNRVSAMATAPYDFAGQMYALLPALYHRYDEAQEPTSDAAVAPKDRPRGNCAAFWICPGSQFDQIYSLARAALGLYDLDRVGGEPAATAGAMDRLADGLQPGSGGAAQRDSLRAADLPDRSA